MTDRTPTSDPVAEPQTEAGRALLAANKRATNLGRIRPVFADEILAIEAEARQQTRAAFAAQVAALREALAEGVDAGFIKHRTPHPEKDKSRCAACRWTAIVRAILAASPEPASPEAPGSGLREASTIPPLPPPNPSLMGLK